MRSRSADCHGLSQGAPAGARRLSREAGRSPAETFRYVLRDGFEFCEWEVRESRAADYDVKKHGALSDEEVRRQARQVVEAAHVGRRARKSGLSGRRGRVTPI